MSVKANDKTGGFTESLAHIESNGEQNIWNYEGPNYDARHEVGNGHVTSSGEKTEVQYDNAGNIASKTWSDKKGDSKTTTYDSSGVLKSYEVKNANGTGSSTDYENGRAVRASTYQNGVSTTTDYGSDGQPVSSFTWDSNTEAKVQRTYTNGKMDSETDTDKNGMVLTRHYFPDGRLEVVQTNDPNSGRSTDTVYNSDGSTTHHEYGKDSATGTYTELSKTDTKDGASHTAIYAGACTSGSEQNCKIASTVDDFPGGSRTGKTFDPTSGKLTSQTDIGPNSYEKTTLYDPKTGFMTSQSETQADGTVHKVNYTGNCSQFGGSDCHKVSEITSDPKSGKIIAAKSCDNQGNCTNVDPKNLPQGFAKAGDKTSGEKRAAALQHIQGTAAVTKNADGSTTSVTKNPDGSSNTVTKKPDGSQVVKSTDKTGATTATELGPDGKTILGIQTFDNKGKQTSATAFGQDGKKTLTRTFDDKGGTITTKFDSAGRPTSVDTVDPNGKLTSVSCHVPALCAKALSQQQAQLSGAKALNAGNKPQGLTGGKQNVKANVLKQIGGKPAGDVKGGNDKLKADVLKQIGDKQGGHLKGSKEKLETSVDKDRQKPGFALGEISPGKKSGDKEKLGVMNTLPLTKHDADVAAGRKDNKGQVHTLPLTKHDAEMASGQKEKSGENHILPYRQPKPRVQESAGNNKKIQTQSVQKFKERKKEWHYPAGKAPNQVVR